ncbi:hypothetical protein BAY59_05910 [Prauserella coralliicola]|nr:hypothetical protein BAY59_05910 [Prauserella coralliicola]
MICPHCHRDLKRSERSDYRCKYCSRLFALEPKEGGIRIHDLRVHRLAEKLTDDGRIHYTLPQLWYAAARGRLPDPFDKIFGIGCFVFIAGIIAVVAAISTDLSWGTALTAVGVLMVVLLLLFFVAWPWYERRAKIRMPEKLGDFRARLLRWEATYNGNLPPGMVDDSKVTVPVVTEPRVAVVCPDPTVLACLAANGVAAAHSAALVGSLDRVPPDVPVVVLHDASPEGIRLAADARAAFGSRVVAPGLRPKAVLAEEKAIKLRERPLPEAEVRGLRALDPALTQEEAGWLGAGWWSPLAAVRPPRLLKVLDRAIARAHGEPDADRRAARQVGFLTWPGA